MGITLEAFVNIVTELHALILCEKCLAEEFPQLNKKKKESQPPFLSSVILL